MSVTPGTTQRPRALLVVLLVLVLAGTAGWFGWRQHRNDHREQVAAANRSTEALLAQTTSLKAPLAIDPTFTACTGIGDLCVTSSASTSDLVAALREQLSGLGISTKATRCTTLTAISGCQLVGHRGAATVLVSYGVHTPYWAQPDWARVRVDDVNDIRPVHSASNPYPLRAAQLLAPTNWQLAPCRDTGETCSRVSVRAIGTPDAAVAAFATRLVGLGYGVGPIGGARDICQTTIGQPRICRFVATRYYAGKGGEQLTSVFLTLQQSGPDVLTGWIGVIGQV
jgi:hypothetical protein